jgi:hypothetical protein
MLEQPQVTNFSEQRKRRKDSRKHTKQEKGLLQDLRHENLTGLINLSQGTESYRVKMPGHVWIRQTLTN